MERLVTTHHLEMTSPDGFRPSSPRSDLRITRVEIPLPELNRFFYVAVGAKWGWYTRQTWNYQAWKDWADRPELETWVGYTDGTPLGYFELESQPEDQVELAYFGLMPDFLGQGFGGPLLSAAIERAWDQGAERVWVHTCSLDHPKALQNYLDRGFSIFKTVEEVENLPDEPLELWPGAIRQT